MGIGRIGRHLLEHRWRVRRVFPADVLASIEQAIRASEATHSGQVRFVVEGALDGKPLFRNQPARERALDIFSKLRIWDTSHNNGVLIYLLLADRNVEIIADRGIDAKVGAKGWEKICAEMEAGFKAGPIKAGQADPHRPARPSDHLLNPLHGVAQGTSRMQQHRRMLDASLRLRNERIQVLSRCPHLFEQQRQLGVQLSQQIL